MPIKKASAKKARKKETLSDDQLSSVAGGIGGVERASHPMLDVSRPVEETPVIRPEVGRLGSSVYEGIKNAPPPKLEIQRPKLEALSIRDAEPQAFRDKKGFLNDVQGHLQVLDQIGPQKFSSLTEVNGQIKTLQNLMDKVQSDIFDFSDMHDVDDSAMNEALRRASETKQQLAYKMAELHGRGQELEKMAREDPSAVQKSAPKAVVPPEVLVDQLGHERAQARESLGMGGGEKRVISRESSGQLVTVKQAQENAASAFAKFLAVAQEKGLKVNLPEGFDVLNLGQKEAAGFFRKLALQVHPDKVGGKEAFQELANARSAFDNIAQAQQGLLEAPSEPARLTFDQPSNDIARPLSGDGRRGDLTALLAREEQAREAARVKKESDFASAALTTMRDQIASDLRGLGDAAIVSKAKIAAPLKVSVDALGKRVTELSKRLPTLALDKPVSAEALAQSAQSIQTIKQQVDDLQTLMGQFSDKAREAKLDMADSISSASEQITALQSDLSQRLQDVQNKQRVLDTTVKSATDRIGEAASGVNSALELATPLLPNNVQVDHDLPDLTRRVDQSIEGLKAQIENLKSAQQNTNNALQQGNIQATVPGLKEIDGKLKAAQDALAQLHETKFSLARMAERNVDVGKLKSPRIEDLNGLLQKSKDKVGKDIKRALAIPNELSALSDRFDASKSLESQKSELARLKLQLQKPAADLARLTGLESGLPALAREGFNKKLAAAREQVRPLQAQVDRLSRQVEAQERFGQLESELASLSGRLNALPESSDMRNAWMVAQNINRGRSRNEGADMGTGRAAAIQGFGDLRNVRVQDRINQHEDQIARQRYGHFADAYGVTRSLPDQIADLEARSGQQGLQERIRRLQTERTALELFARSGAGDATKALKVNETDLAQAQGQTEDGMNARLLKLQEQHRIFEGTRGSKLAQTELPKLATEIGDIKNKLSALAELKEKRKQLEAAQQTVREAPAGNEWLKGEFARVDTERNRILAERNMPAWDGNNSIRRDGDVYDLRTATGVQKAAAFFTSLLGDGTKKAKGGSYNINGTNKSAGDARDIMREQTVQAYVDTGRRYEALHQRLVAEVAGVDKGTGNPALVEKLRGQMAELNGQMKSLKSLMENPEMVKAWKQKSKTDTKPADETALAQKYGDSPQAVDRRMDKINRDVVPMTTAEKRAALKDYADSVRTMSKEDRDSAISKLGKTVTHEDLDRILPQLGVATPTEDIPAGKLKSIHEMLATEMSHNEALANNIRTLEDEGFQGVFSKDADKAYVLQMAEKLKAAKKMSDGLISQFYSLTGVTRDKTGKPDPDIMTQFNSMTSQEKTNLVTNYLRLFHSARDPANVDSLPAFRDLAANNWDVISQNSKWADLIQRNRDKLNQYAGEVMAEKPYIANFASAQAWSAPQAVVQRNPRYGLLLKELAESLPASWRTQVDLTRLREKANGNYINRQQAAVDRGEQSV